MNKKEDLIKYWIDENIVSDKRIIDAFQKINRENFVPEEYKNLAYNEYEPNNSRALKHLLKYWESI